MAWEDRNGRSYFYRKERVGGRVVSTYLGTGYVCEALHKMHLARRAEAERERSAREAERGRIRAAEHAMDKAERFTRLLTRLCLVATGYHMHRGQWRKRRAAPLHDQRPDIWPLPDMKTLDYTINESHHSLPVADSLDIDALAKLNDRLSKDNPKREDVRAFRALLQDNPGLWRMAGDLSGLARAALGRQAASKNAGAQIAIEQGMQEEQNALGYQTASPLERLLIEQIVTAAFHLSEMQRRYYGVTGERHSLAIGEYYEKRVTAAQRRYLRACEALARVRRLSSRTPLQINVAQQQIVMAGEGGA